MNKKDKEYLKEFFKPVNEIIKDNVKFGRKVTLKEDVIYTGLDENWYPEFIKDICDMQDKMMRDNLSEQLKQDT
jgi:hypothetical protein